MISRLSALSMVMLLLTGLLVMFGAGSAHAADRDCGDFSTQRAAQEFFLDHRPAADPHSLDADGDRIACESNPCPCLYESGGDDGGTDAGETRSQRARVTNVVDGDTVDVRLGSGSTPRVRMIGIDTPEVYGGSECGGSQASRSLERLLPRGTRVKLVSDPTQDGVDRYGRILRYVVKAGRDINRTQLGRGWARVYVYNNDPFKRVSSYRKAQRRATANDRGIWGVC